MSLLLSAEMIALLFLFAAVTSLWRWNYTRYGAVLGWCVIFSSGVMFYLWLHSPLYSPQISRWWLRILLVALVAPHLLINIDVIRARRRERKLQDHG